VHIFELFSSQSNHTINYICFFFFFSSVDLLSLKNSKEIPENPLQALTDYFGAYKDKKEWEVFDGLTNSTKDLKDENARLEEEIVTLH